MGRGVTRTGLRLLLRSVFIPPTYGERGARHEHGVFPLGKQTALVGLEGRSACGILHAYDDVSKHLKSEHGYVGTISVKQ